ncbi:sugar kinase [Phormidium pseudopriestleyi FRX01]|uniref:Sugar kinase n=1 Tax=Phormidium pseudopriestleyi FRX01 TaxID=1759528 RepID=A0ABS3FTV8_9CYAN|nr:sugar kinase [Phormidium pseudopriestleyi]MBO0350572.1 sugar kinase [Phormidium pseudopriestleyi FRX01]
MEESAALNPDDKTLKKQGLFVGLVTLDVIYLTAGVPQNNQKIVATDSMINAGGPATNAAIAFSYLGNHSTLVGAIGQHPLTAIVYEELEQYGVAIADLDPQRTEPPPLSSIIVTEATGDRAVISINATKSQILGDRLPLDSWSKFNIVLTDGHQMSVSQRIAQITHAQTIPIVLDGGSWKPGFENLLPFINYALCSSNFYPPNCHNSSEVFTYLANRGIPHIAITNGENPIQYLSQGIPGWVEVPKVKALDTLGAGDIFHGGFCHYILQETFPQALASAAIIASDACQGFGTRHCMTLT